MDANDAHTQKQVIFQDVWPQIYQNTQERRLQNNFEEKQKKLFYENSQQSLKQVKPWKKNNEIQNKNKTQEREVLNSVNQINLRQKRPNNFQIRSEQRYVQKNKTSLGSNGKINSSQKLKNWNTDGYLNECSSYTILRNQIYNTVPQILYDINHLKSGYFHVLELKHFLYHKTIFIFTKFLMPDKQVPSDVKKQFQLHVKTANHIQLIKIRQKNVIKKQTIRTMFIQKILFKALNGLYRLDILRSSHYNQKGEIKRGFKQIQKSSQKNQKKSTHYPASISSQKQLQILTKQQLQMFLQGSDMVYPIPEYVIQLDGLTQNSMSIIEALKPKTLPIGFCYLLQMLNLSYLFPDMFKFEKETITRIVQILQAPSDQIQNQLNDLLEQNFKNFMNLLSALIIEDLNSDRLLAITDKHAHNILSLAKFSQDNQLLEFVFKYNWPLILTQLVNISVEQSKEQNIKFQESIKYTKNNILTQSFNIPQKFELRFQLISLLIDSYSKTNLFRDLFNKKIELNRNMNKRKSELEEEKKNIQQKIKKMQYTKEKKTKKIVKKDKIKSKNLQQDSEEPSQKQGNPNRLESIEKLSKQFQQIQQEIQKQNRQDSLSCCHYLGKDHNNNLYWHVSFFSEKLFIQRRDSTWLCLQIDQINQFLDSLNRKNIDQNRLFQNVHEYYHSSINKHMAKMEIETQENNGQNHCGNHHKSMSASLQNAQIDLQNLIEPENSVQHDSSKNSNENEELLVGLGAFRIDQQSLLRMIELGQKKMTEYLKDRNSRWGTEQNKQTLFSTIMGSGPNWLEEAKKQIFLFNQKICVVEIQYKVFVQQSVEQVDSKIKKIQTKIWGINEKFKHNWYDFISSASCFSELFFAVSVLYTLIKKYTSKHRKLRKQYEEIKQKTVWKNTAGNKEWKQTWNQVCQVCGTTGEVLCCDFCPKVYHLECIKMSEIPEDQFKCKSCTQQITTRHQMKSIANEGHKKNKK